MYTIHATTDRKRALQLLERAQAFAVDGAQLEDMVSGCNLLGVHEGGRLVGAFALEVFTDVDGARVVGVTAAGGEPGHNLVPAMYDYTADLARSIGADEMRCRTRRPGLARLMRRRGAEVDGTRLRKVLRGQQ